jgi:hypothetical protein
MLRILMISVAVLVAAFSVHASAASSPLAREMRPKGTFEQNRGQYEDATAFVGRFPGFGAAVMKDGSIVVAPDQAPDSKVRIRATGGRQPASISGLEKTEYRTNYFGSKGPPITDVPHYTRVSAESLYPGIDLVYYASSGKLEFDFVVQAGSRADSIRLAVEGASSISVDVQGDLVIETEGGSLVQRKPMAFQLQDGARVPVDCSYKILDSKTVRLDLASYDRSRDLIIDPVMEFSTYLGGANYDQPGGVKIGPGGFIYVVGSAQGSNFPLVAPYDGSLGGSQDAFITKINPATGKAVYSTFLGDRNHDRALALDVDAQGQVYVVGRAGDRFPTTAGAYRTTWSDPSGFVVKFNAAGNALLYSTLLPGATPQGIVVDPDGRAVLAGDAGTAFSTTPGAFQSTAAAGSNPHNGNAFVMRLNAAGSAADFATFYRGITGGGASAVGVALDPSGNIVIAGTASSSNLPMASDAMDTTGNAGGWSDGYVAVFNPEGSALVASTYLGGSGGEDIAGIAVDASGAIAVVGRSESADFPLVNALMGYEGLTPSGGIYRKVFVTKLAREPMRILFSTFAGSKVACCEWGFDIAIDSAGDIYVTSETSIGDLQYFESKHGFLSAAYVQSVQSDGSMAILTAIRRDGGSLIYNMLAAPSRTAPLDKIAIAAKSPGQVVITGQTNRAWLPIAPANLKAAVTDTFYTDGFVMSLTTEVPDLALETSVVEAAAATSVKLTASTFGSTAEQTVTFWDGTTSLGTALLAGGIASLNASFPTGVRRLKATLGALQSSEIILPVYVPSGVCQ